MEICGIQVAYYSYLQPRRYPVPSSFRIFHFLQRRFSADFDWIGCDSTTVCLTHVNCALRKFRSVSNRTAAPLKRYKTAFPLKCFNENSNGRTQYLLLAQVRMRTNRTIFCSNQQQIYLTSLNGITQRRIILAD